jgi:signal transduction histidine kinase
MESIKVNFNVNVKPELLKLAEKSSLQIKVNLQSIDRIITNLLGNAIKFTPENGCISLQFDLSADMKYLIIQVSDSGIGISEKELPHIFDRLYRNFRAFNNKSKSNGLGLAIVQELVEYHDGEIWVESEINKGSDFLKVRIKYTAMKNYLMNYGELKV